MQETGDADFYTIREAARVLHVSEATVWRWVDAERLPAYRVGPRRIRIKKADLKSMVQPAKVKGTRAGEQKTDIWADYDPQRVREALRASAGILKGIDKEKLLAELREERSQHSHGRPTDY